MRGGLRGADPLLAQARIEHAELRKERLRQKQLRREEKKALFNRQTNVLERLLGVYKVMSGELPSLCKYINLLR